MCNQHHNLRLLCMTLGAVMFGAHVAAYIYAKNPDFLTIVLLTLAMVIGLALFLGALFENEIVVLVALILHSFQLLYTVIVVVGVIFDLGDFRDKELFDDVTRKVIFVSVRIVLQFYILYLIYIYYKELHNREDD